MEHLYFWRAKWTAVSIVDDIVTSPVVDGSTVFVANASGRITALNLDNGERIWGNPLEPLEISGRRVIAYFW